MGHVYKATYNINPFCVIPLSVPVFVETSNQFY